MLKNPYEYKRVARTQQELNAIMREHERYVDGQGGLRAQLAHADFAGASLVGASLYASNLHRASLYCADLRNCDLRMTKLVRADLRGASFKGARLAYSVLDNADLRSVMMMYMVAGGPSLVDRNSPDTNEPGNN